MTREQHVWAATHFSGGMDLLVTGGSGLHGVAVAFAIAAGHHGRAALRCEACEGEGEFPGHPVDYTERCTDCDGTGWRSL